VATLAQRHGGGTAPAQVSPRQAPWAVVSIHRPGIAGSVGNVPSMATPRSSSPGGLFRTPKGQTRCLTNRGSTSATGTASPLVGRGRQQAPPSFEMRCRSLAAKAHAAVAPVNLEAAEFVSHAELAGVNDGNLKHKLPDAVVHDISQAAMEVAAAAEAARQARQEELQTQEQRPFKEAHQLLGDRDDVEDGVVSTEKAQMAVETLTAVDRALQSARFALETARRTRGFRSARTAGPAPQECGNPLPQRGCSMRVPGAGASKPREDLTQLVSAPRPLLPEGFVTRGSSPGLSLQSTAPLFGGSPLSRSPVGVARSSFLTPDASPSHASAARSPSSLAAARTSHKEQVGAVENARAFTVSLLRKLDELHEQNLEARICSLQMGSRRPARGAGAASEQFAECA